MRNKKFAFTLAEMMVVMLVLTILLAAFAPLMTKRKTTSSESPWRWAVNNNDSYFGLGANQTAMIGQSEKTANDGDAKLIVNSGNANFILFKNNGTSVAKLIAGSNNLLLSSLTSVSGSNNIAFGLGALNNLSDKSHNIAIGPNAMGVDPSTSLTIPTIGTPSVANIAIGENALARVGNFGNNATKPYASNNVAMGYYALANNYYGIGNVAIGSEVLSHNVGVASASSSGNYNTSVGHESLYNNNAGYYNSALGYRASYNNTSGAYNVAIGDQSLYNNEGGSYNTAIGHQACYNVTGSNKTCIGAGSGPDSTDSNATNDKEVIYLGNSNTTVVVPGNLVVQGINVDGNNFAKGGLYVDGVILARGGVWSDFEGLSDYPNYTNGFFRFLDIDNDSPGWSQYHMGNPGDYEQFDFTWIQGWDTSDKRLKNIKGENKSGLEQIRELKVFDFTFKKDKDKTPHVGVIAQDLQKIFPNAVTKGEDGYLRIRHEDMFYALVNAVKQLDKIVQALISEIKVDLQKVYKHDDEIKALQKQNKELIKKNQELEKRIERLEKIVDKK